MVWCGILAVIAMILPYVGWFGYWLFVKADITRPYADLFFHLWIPAYFLDATIGHFFIGGIASWILGTALQGQVELCAPEDDSFFDTKNHNTDISPNIMLDHEYHYLPGNIYNTDSYRDFNNHN